MTSLQQHLDSQQAFFKIKKREHALTIQALEQESAHQEAVQWCIKHEQTTVHKLISILNKLEFINAENLNVDFLKNISLVTLLHEWESMKSKIPQNELEGTAEGL